MRLLVGGVHCCACLTHYHSRERLVTHLTYNSPVCKTYYVNHHTPMSLEESNALDTAERQTLLKANFRKGRSEGFTNGLKAFRRVGPLASDVQLSQYRGKRVPKNIQNIEVKLDWLTNFGVQWVSTECWSPNGSEFLFSIEVVILFFICLIWLSSFTSIKCMFFLLLHVFQFPKEPDRRCVRTAEPKKKGFWAEPDRHCVRTAEWEGLWGQKLFQPQRSINHTLGLMHPHR